jgi:hypothetical protein
MAVALGDYAELLRRMKRNPEAAALEERAKASLIGK